jgi:hypothetical protein
MGLVDWLAKRNSPPTEHPFHITIGSASSKAFDLQNDLRMLRSAVAYAEKVKLCSTSMSHMYSVLNYSKDLKSFVAYLEEVYRSHPDPARRERLAQTIDFLREALRKSPRQQEKNELFVMSMLKRKMQEQRNDLKAKYPALAKENEIKGIMKAVNSGILELHTFQSLQIETLMAVLHSGETPNEAGITPSTERIVEEYLEITASAVMEGATYPMFDDTTGQLVKARLEEKGQTLSDIRMQRARHSALAGALLESLPDFSHAPIDEIIDIRKELREPLDRFRGGVSTYAASMKTIPWNKDFADEANELFTQKVKPGILELDDLVKSASGPLSHIGREVAKAKSLIGGGAAIGFFVDTPDSLPQYVRMALGSVLPLTFAVSEGIKSYQNERRKIKNHTLYFYCRLRDKFER